VPDPGPVPDAPTVTSTVAFGALISVTVTVAGGAKLNEGDVRRIVRVDPVIDAVTFALLEATLYDPDPPEIATVCAEQLVSVTLVGVATNGHVPERFTVMLAPVVPSDTPTLTEPVGAADPARRLSVTVFPEIDATTLSLPELTK
jgi:hypothetical protein